MDTTLNFRPHPAALKLLSKEAEEAKEMNRRPRFTKPEEVFDTQCLYDGDELLGYCGYKPGMGLALIAHGLPAAFVEECKAFLVANGLAPRATSVAPKLVADPRTSIPEDDGQ